MFKVLFNPKQRYSLKFKVPQSVKVGFIVFWNFNEDKKIGVRNCKIYYKNSKIYEGILQMGSGLSCSDYFQIIKADKELDE